jgi:hypothetical protein
MDNEKYSLYLIHTDGYEELIGRGSLNPLMVEVSTILSNVAPHMAELRLYQDDNKTLHTLWELFDTGYSIGDLVYFLIKDGKSSRYIGPLKVIRNGQIMEAEVTDNSKKRILSETNDNVIHIGDLKSDGKPQTYISYYEYVVKERALADAWLEGMNKK